MTTPEKSSESSKDRLDNEVPSDHIGTSRVLAEWKKRREDLNRELQELPHTQETYSEQEIERVREINSQLKIFISDFEARMAGVDKGDPQYQAEGKKGLVEVMAYLDSLPIWVHKFSTEPGGGTGNDPLTHSDIDSVYYMMEKGISIRIRRMSIRDGDGFNTAIQPFMEKTFFRYAGKQALLKFPMETVPIPRLIVTDCLTKEFDNKIKSQDKGDFQSPLVVWQKEDLPYEVDGPEGLWVHRGDRVNKIFFSRE